MMKRLLLALVLACALSAPAWAGFDESVAAYERGDYETAYHELLPLAEQGNATAQNLLGVMYAKGQGVTQDYGEAVKWYRRAAEQGNATAQSNLGFMYGNGKGVVQDYAEAMKWYRRAAEQGNASAQDHLGFMYGNGKGVTQDYIQAHMWFNLAAAGSPPGEDYDRTVRNRDIAEKRMTPAQVAEAQKLAREWKPKAQAETRPTPSSTEPDAVSRETIKNAQNNLVLLGYDPGPTDGVMGHKTRTAIRSFQADQGLPVTGELSDALSNALLVETLLLLSKQSKKGGS